MSDRTTLWFDPESLLQGISVVSVILSFQKGRLRVLLNKYNDSKLWMLPAGFAHKTEDLDKEANRILKFRTGIDNVFLQQFHTFGDFNRINSEENKQVLIDNNIQINDHWFVRRFIAVAYYSLVYYLHVKIEPSRYNDVAEWFDLDKIPKLYSDQNLIIETALCTIRKQLGHIPLAASLLSDKFTLSELRVLYECFMNKSLDPRNFQRKILGLNLLHKVGETRKMKGVKDTTLYSFDKEKYETAIVNGTLFVNK